MEMPKRDWLWSYDSFKNRLTLSVGSYNDFYTPYTASMLLPMSLGSSSFTQEQANFYVKMYRKLEKTINATESALTQVVLNAVAARFMTLPQGPKSWFFEPSNECVYSEAGKLFELRNKNNDAILVLVIEANLQTSLVMILSADCQLNATKSLPQFGIIKVMQDRLHPCSSKTMAQIVAA